MLDRPNAGLNLKDAESQGALEAIYVDRDGYLLEGTTSNLFVVRDGCLITPPCDRLLPGITRQVILKLAKDVHPETLSSNDTVL